MTNVCLTFDFDAVSLWITTMRQTSATPLSRGEFGALVGVPRVLALLAEKDIRATFFVPAHTAAAFPAETLQIRDAGHEIALHGYCHETPVGLSRDDEGRMLDRALKKMRKVLGADFNPKGYRSPAWDLTADTVSLLAERGLLYDSSMMADDYRPYRARTGYVATEDQYERGEPSDVIEIPVAWELDDFPHFTFLNKPMYLGMRTPVEVFELWKEEFDFCHSLGDGVFTLTLHPQVIGRGPRIAMLSRLIDYMRQAPGVEIRTVAEVAEERGRRLLRT
ncbi:polysaccharide deacetylase family protein [Sinorhizobium mexicanum]|uniref:Chitooligosaccharide deacetylase n=1 Tax=Sinorhizobium mexicanum TaxID=375549 RepID=A0A859QMP5_9HYPH|nr:polysaccharide deacetylase [Sinorhizobium mexicanum]MBP1881780.1 peptidoglycan/xylan/chitin deacetylase (PgdA/CDA1 family) [Sinorhizobium mexicanum]QLL61536.1 polysaccharide deacetylase [Sinorhizobium mexicanum]